MKKRLKINGILIFLAVVALVLFYKIFFRINEARYPDMIIETLGLILIICGQLLRVSARGFKAEHSQQGNVLLQSGPYSLVRNPMYLGILLIGLGIVLMLFRWWVIFLFLAIFFLRYMLLTYEEERKLTALFGKDYLEYKLRVPRILPSLATLCKMKFSEYFPLKISWIKKEIGSIITVLLLALLLESWEDIRSKGLPAYLKEFALMLIVLLMFTLFIIYLNKKTTASSIDVSNKS